MIIVLAKLYGADTPAAVTDWGKNHAKQIVEWLRLERQFQWWRNGHCCRNSYQIEYGINSLTSQEASPARLLQIRRAHWGIETGLHHRRDVTLHEDITRMAVGNTSKVMASINLVLALIRQTNFHNAAQARR